MNRKPQIDGGEKRNEKKRKEKGSIPQEKQTKEELECIWGWWDPWGVVWGEKGVVRQEIEAIWNLGLGVMGFVWDSEESYW